MRTEKNLLLCTVDELAFHIVESDCKGYAFAVVSDCDINDDLETIDKMAVGWYGVKKLNHPFDGEKQVVAVGYYGGGRLSIAEMQENVYDSAREVEHALLNSLDYADIADGFTMVIVERLGTESNA